MPTKRILFFIQDGVGGAERMTINIQKTLPNNDYEFIYCKIIHPLKIQSGRIDLIIPENSIITSISWNNQIGLLMQLNKAIRKYKPDMVFSSAMHINQRLLLLSLLFKNIRYIVRNDNYLYTLPNLKRQSLKLTYKLANTVIAQTEEMKNELIKNGVNKNKIIVLHNNIDKESISLKASEPNPYPTDNKTRFVSVGRFATEKGFDLLIKAYSEVVKKISDSELYIVGNYEYNNRKVYNELLLLIKRNNLEDKVHFTGYTSNPYKYIKNASVFVLSSRNEGLPNVLIESQFLGTPAAAFKCIPIIERIVKERVNGFLAEKENYIELAEAMCNAVLLYNTPYTYEETSPRDIQQIFS